MSESTVTTFPDESATLSLTDDNKTTLINLAITNVVNLLCNGYYHPSNHQFSWLVNESTFDGIWNDYPQLRSGLVSFLINCSRHNTYYDSKPLVSGEFSNKKLASIEASLRSKDDDVSDLIRRTIIPAIYPDFNYKSEIISMMESEGRKPFYNAWIDLASNYSKDEDLFEFLISNIKREEGATEIKINILNRAFANGVICESSIKKIANSAPISLKRTVVTGLVSAIKQYRTEIRYKHHPVGQEKSVIEKCDKVENLAMLFAGLNDRHILRELGVSLSVKNLPWILPAAANYPWIVKEIQRRIDAEGV